MTMEQINERLKDILSNKFKDKLIKDKDVADALGIDPNNYAQLKFRNSVPYKQILDFLFKEGISINLFFYGKDASNSDNLKTLRMFDVGASLGGGANNDDESFENVVISEQILEKSNVKFLGKIDIIKAIGESMEPYIMDGDSCFIAVGAEFKDGEIYAINTPDGLMIKECYKQGNEFMLISYNPIYLPVRYSIYECKIVGMFVGIIRGRGKFKINLKEV
ncbi:hypothetical protein CYJ41_08010 [Campylobacter ureolyticus]|uniref:Peptidase S24/S26A/S26B/S26C domain-containing protein n=1 Tax=Campylobacter ureolyticus TaxID=827 RepID=A0A2I1N8F3_9BACT|nr:S24 family peptidase [Campylobacter ureolyticus]PKZ28652.1 hypothetical protein CYJ41_08010 [Campylobacter ureolyticus]